MKIQRFYNSLVIVLLLAINTSSQTSDRILKYYDAYSHGEFFINDIEFPFSSQLLCRASVTKEKFDGTYYMMAFATDKLRHLVVYADVADELNQKLDTYGEPGTGEGQFLNPHGAAADQYGNVYIADTGNNRIVKLQCDFETGDMTFIQNMTQNFNQPMDVAISTNNTPEDPLDDRIWVADCENHRIVELTVNGSFLREFGTMGSDSMQFDRPVSLKIYGYGTNNLVYLTVGDAGNNRLVNMGTDGTWNDIILTQEDEIVNVDIYDEEIYVLERNSGLVHKIRWPDVYLSQYVLKSSDLSADPQGFNFPNSMTIPFPEQMPYICVFEQFTDNTGCKLNLQGLDILELEGISNVNGTAAQVDYRLPTNSVITEQVVDENGNVIKTLTDGIILDSAPIVSATWYGDDASGNPVPGGTYYYQCSARTKWEYDDSGTPLLKRIINSIFTSSGEPGDTLLKSYRIDMPITLTYIPGPDDGIDNTIYKSTSSGVVADENQGSSNLIMFGPSPGDTRRAIVKFNLSNIGLTKRDKVTDASLMLRLAYLDNTETQTINVHRILVPWDELTSCWNRAQDGSPIWNGCIPDGKFASEEIYGSFQAFTETGWYEWYGENITGLVQDWLTNPASNYGVLFKLENDDTGELHRFHFFSSDAADSTVRPRVEIVYEKNVLYPAFKAEIVCDKTSGPAPLTVILDASNSYSPADIKEYSWDFNSSDGIEEDTTGIRLTHTFENPGTYEVTLTTTDSAEIRGHDTQIIKVYGDTLFADDFEDQNADSWTKLDETRWTVDQDNGSFVFYINTTNYSAQPGGLPGEYALIDNETFGDFTLTCCARTRESTIELWTDYCFIFGYQDPANYYLMKITKTSSGTKLCKVVDGTVTELGGTWRTLIQDNSFHDIEITRINNGISVKYDSDPVIYLIDDTFGSGKIGMGSMDDAASFDDIVITLPDGTDPSDPAEAFTDNFEDGDALGWTPMQFDRWTVGQDGTGNVYYINTTNYQAGPDGKLGEYSLLDNRYYNDFKLTCRARSRDNLEYWTDYAVIFGYQNENNYYFMQLYKINQSALMKIENGQKYTVATTPRYLIQDNDFHHIEINRIGNDITIKYDSDPVITVTDSSFGQGRIGFGSLDDGASFDNVKILADTLAFNPPENIIFTEDFADGNMTGWSVVDLGTVSAPSDWQVSGGELCQLSNIVDNSGTSAGRVGTIAFWDDPDAQLWTDYELELNLRSSDDDGIGVLLYYQDTDNYYRFEMDKQRAFRKLIKRVNGTVTLLAQENTGYNQNQNYTFNIQASGGLITVSLDGSELFGGSVTDCDFMQGTIGFHCWGNAGSYFDNITVTTGGLAKSATSQTDKKIIPNEFAFRQNYPNPFNPVTTICYQLPVDTRVTMKIYDMLGRELVTLIDRNQDAGYHQIIWDSRDRRGVPVSTGVYIVRIIAGEFKAVRKMVLLR